MISPCLFIIQEILVEGTDTICIVSYCSNKKQPISNLKLQKILYYAWIDYYKRTGNALFLNDICAWQLGPVIPDVYYEFCSYAGTPIFESFDVSIDSKK